MNTIPTDSGLNTRTILRANTSESSALRPQSFSFPALEALACLFTLNLTLQPPVDPDFGWHLRSGLDLVANRGEVPTTDPYSHTMPDWPWVEHAWLTDLLMGLIYRSSASGLLAISLLFAVITAVAFVAAVRPAKAGRTVQLVAVVVALWIARPFLGVRTQMVTLLGLALVLWIWHRIVSTDSLSADAVPASGLGRRRIRWWTIPLLFLLWANLHGGFVAGLMVLGALLVGSAVLRLTGTVGDEAVPCWRTMRRIGLAFVLGVVVTVINPYGLRLYGEIIASLSDRFMLETLHEWQPVSWDNPGGRLYLLYVVALGVTMLLFYRRREPLRLVLLGVFLVWSLRHWRNIPFFLLLSLPLVAELLATAANRFNTRLPALVRHPRHWLFAVTLGAAAAATILGPEHLQRVVQAGLAPEEFFAETEYPMEAVRWAQAHPGSVGSRLYNDYGFGGFLVWQLPEHKVFIDGRMPAWRIGNRWIFYDYVALTAWDPPELRVLSKYAVDWALVSRGTPLQEALGREPGWMEAYRDRKVMMYVKQAAR